VSVNGQPLTINSKGVNIDLSNYAQKSDLAAVLEWKGSVETFDDLPSNPQVGDVYNIVQEDADNDIPAGGNVAWDGSAGDVLGPLVQFNGISNTEIDALFA
jgi:hypothetical protein